MANQSATPYVSAPHRASGNSNQNPVFQVRETGVRNRGGESGNRMPVSIKIAVPRCGGRVRLTPTLVFHHRALFVKHTPCLSGVRKPG